MTALSRELEMIRLIAAPENNSIEAVVADEGIENAESQAVRVHLRNLGEAISRSSNA